MGGRVCNVMWVTDKSYKLYLQNGELFRQFEEAATKAYLVIRQNANLFITLFSMVTIQLSSNNVTLFLDEMHGDS